MISSPSQRRRLRATAAELLLSLHAGDNLLEPVSWTWQQLDRLPAWCLQGAEQRKALQLVSGALFLGPELRFWIHRDSLNALQQMLGGDLLDSIVARADSVNLPREPAAAIISDAGVNSAEIDAGRLEHLLLGAGSAVLGATVHESLPREMLTGSLGEPVGNLDEVTAEALLGLAEMLLNQDQVAHATESAYPDTVGQLDDEVTTENDDPDTGSQESVSDFDATEAQAV
jgi:hypothetical protein